MNSISVGWFIFIRNILSKFKTPMISSLCEPGETMLMNLPLRASLCISEPKPFMIHKPSSVAKMMTCWESIFIFAKRVTCGCWPFGNSNFSQFLPLSFVDQRPLSDPPNQLSESFLSTATKRITVAGRYLIIDDESQLSGTSVCLSHRHSSWSKNIPVIPKRNNHSAAARPIQRWILNNDWRFI